MRVLLLGGTGVFGSRLARLLVRDGHAVTIAARNLSAAQSLADELNCVAIRMDRDGDLQGLAGHDVLVDAAGPFHAYGADPYRLARAALSAGLHYLDLSDNAEFCAGIAALDAEARAAGLCAISGLSSVPALSSAAVRSLCDDAVPQVIEAAILPGNRAPRGLSVMASILNQAGSPMRVWRGGAWTPASGWSDPRWYRLPGGLVRQGWQIEVPDLQLFPAHFRAETVVFRAGLELAVMRYGLWAFALLRRWLPIPISRPVLHGFKLAADLLSRFGSDRGGMSVMVVTGGERRWWRLLAENGDGPFIPGIATRALLRRATMTAGAFPALEAITLAEAEAAMADLSVLTDRITEAVRPLFPSVLGDAFDSLPDAVRTTHRTAHTSRWHGRASVRRGTTLWSRLLGRLFAFPPSGDDVAVEVVKTVNGDGETWLRTFGDRAFRSRLSATPEGMMESFGPFRFLLGLHVRDAALHFPVRAGRIGPIRLPYWLLPVSEAREYARNGCFQLDVKVLAPVTRDLLVHYRGSLDAANPGTV